MEPIRVSVDYSAEDYVRAAIHLNRRNFVYRHAALILAALIFLVIFAFIFALRDPSDTASLWLSVLAAGLPAIVVGGAVSLGSRVIDPWFAKRAVKKMISRSPILQERNDIEFNELGMEATTFLGSGSVKWGAFIEAFESESDFYFLTGPKSRTFVPKTAFESESDLERLRHLIRENLGDRARLN